VSALQADLESVRSLEGNSNTGDNPIVFEISENSKGVL
jgi:hypothetical protein